MSHFTVGILLPTRELSRVEAFVAEQMAPFDESLTVAPYVCYDLEQAERDLLRNIAEFEAMLATGDEQRFNLARCREELARLQTMSPEDTYREYCRYHERLDRTGRPISTYNPQAKWDWYAIGGRWDGWLHDIDGSRETVEDNLAPVEQVLTSEKFPFAIITLDGEWLQRGQMGWFGIVRDDQGDAAWHEQLRQLLTEYRDHQLVLVDAHI